MSACSIGRLAVRVHLVLMPMSEHMRIITCMHPSLVAERKLLTADQTA